MDPRYRNKYQQFKKMIHDGITEGNALDCLLVFWNNGLVYNHDREEVMTDFWEMVHGFNVAIQQTVSEDAIARILGEPTRQRYRKEVLDLTGIDIQFVNKKNQRKKCVREEREAITKQIIVIAEPVLKENPLVSYRALESILRCKGISVGMKTLSTMPEIRELKKEKVKE